VFAYEFENKVHEIDLVTSFFKHVQPNYKTVEELQETVTTMVIECKKTSSKPWVLFSSPHYRFDDLTELLIHDTNLNLTLAREGRRLLVPQISSSLKGCYLGKSTMPRCVAYHEALKDPDQPSAIYKAIDSVLTYIAHMRSRFSDDYALRSWFYIPVILIEGQLFEASIADNDDVELIERTHLQLRTFYRHQLFVIDVVTKASFDKLVKEVATLHHRIVKAIGGLQVDKPSLDLARIQSGYSGTF
jgi:hypothetical protein